MNNKKPSLIKTYFFVALILLLILIVLFFSMNKTNVSGENFSLGDCVITFVFLIIFSIVDVFLWMQFVKRILIERKAKQTIKLGDSTTGTYIKHSLLMEANGVGVFQIFFVCKDAFGNVQEYVSSNTYTLAEAKMFETLKTFEVKVYRGNAVITTDPKTGLKGDKLNNFLNNKKRETCKYCGSVLDKKLDKCKSCGATIVED